MNPDKGVSGVVAVSAAGWAVRAAAREPGRLGLHKPDWQNVGSERAAGPREQGGGPLSRRDGSPVSQIAQGVAKEIDAHAERLYTLLAGDGHYSVPPYQRDYAWEAEQTNKLLDDVLRVADTDSGTYFLGAMVFVVKDEPNRRYEVLDGQQRFASLLLLLRALQSILSERGASASTTSQIESMIFAPDVYNNTPSGQPFVHIQMNDEDRDYFNETLVASDPPEPQRGSHRLIAKAFAYFRDKLKDSVPAEDQNELDEYWNALRKGLASRLYVIRVEVWDAVDAQMVFEALNSAGMDLTAADLVKNHVLSIVPQPQFAKTYAHWRSAVDNVGDEQLTRYLRASWNSKYAFAREAELYKQVHERVVASGHQKTRTAAAIYVKELDDESIDWVDLRNPDGATWMNPFPDLRADLNDLRSLDARLAYVPLLALRAAYRSQHTDFQEAARWFRDFYVRHTIVGGRAANEVEEDYSKWAVALRNGTLPLPDLRKKLASLCPDDESFRQSFKTLQIRRLLTARVLLARINDSVNKDNALSETHLSGKKIHVEHVVPQRPNSEWKEFLEAEGTQHEDVVNSIGNLTLLLGPKNIRAGNKEFSEKKPKYVATGAPINEYLASLNSFGRAQVEERAAKLADLATKVWKQP
jgi:hypothetical protein